MKPANSRQLNLIAVSLCLSKLLFAKVNVLTIFFRCFMFPKYVEEVFSSPPGIIILECLGNPKDAHNLLKINPFLRQSLNLFIRKQDYSFTLKFLDKMRNLTRTRMDYDKELKEVLSPLRESILIVSNLTSIK